MFKFVKKLATKATVAVFALAAAVLVGTSAMAQTSGSGAAVTIDSGSSVDMSGLATSMGGKLAIVLAAIIGVGVAIVIAKKAYAALRTWIKA